MGLRVVRLIEGTRSAQIEGCICLKLLFMQCAITGFRLVEKRALCFHHGFSIIVALFSSSPPFKHPCFSCRPGQVVDSLYKMAPNLTHLCDL